MRTSQELDQLRTQAVELRRQGKSRRQIKQILGPMSNVTRSEALAGVRRYWAAERPAREAQRTAARSAAAAQIGELTDRELLIAGAIAYWCEGSKNKPDRRSDRVDFINSDPSLIRFFLRFLATTGTPFESLTFRVYIHENADAKAAELFWLKVTGARPEQFLRTTLKHHQPKTVRKNVGENYHGCLRIDVQRGSSLYREIEGWVEAITSGA
jgi:hypothetical protein